MWENGLRSSCCEFAAPVQSLSRQPSPPHAPAKSLNNQALRMPGGPHQQLTPVGRFGWKKEGREVDRAACKCQPSASACYLPRPWHAPATGQRPPHPFHAPAMCLPHPFHAPAMCLPHPFHAPAMCLPHPFHAPALRLFVPSMRLPRLLHAPAMHL
eukprot:365443-Chlamydomonas_euryale.AAC.17